MRSRVAVSSRADGPVTLTVLVEAKVSRQSVVKEASVGLVRLKTSSS